MKTKEEIWNEWLNKNITSTEAILAAMDEYAKQAFEAGRKPHKTGYFGYDDYEDFVRVTKEVVVFNNKFNVIVQS